jgi:hypothetical protein
LFLAYKQYDDYFQVERINEAQEYLEKRINFTIYDARKLTGHTTYNTTEVNDVCHADTPITTLMDMRSKGIFPPYSTLYDDSIIKLSSKIYAMDIALYKKKFGSSCLLFND